MKYSQTEMERLTAGLPTKSAKIRELGKAGYARQQIADFLGIRYQHVRNVLVDAERRAKAGQGSGREPHRLRAGEGAGMAEAEKRFRAEPSPSSPVAYGGLYVGPDGSAVIPASVLEKAGLHAGDRFVADVAGTGEVRLLAGAAARRYAQELIRNMIPADADLLEDLAALRHRQSERERRLAGHSDD